MWNKLVLFLCVVFFNQVQAEETCKFKPVIGFELNIPFQIKKGSAYSGFDIEVIKHVLDSMGCSYEFQDLPWARQLNLLEKKQNIVLVSASFSQKRAELGYYSDRYFKSSNKLYVLKDKIPLLYNDKNEIKSLKQIIDENHFTIGITRGYSYGEKFNEVFSSYRKKLEDTKQLNDKKVFYDVTVQDRIFDMVINNHLSAFIANSEMVSNYLNKKGIDVNDFNFVQTDVQLMNNPNVYFLFSQYFTHDFVEKFNDKLKEFDKKNGIKILLEKYFDKLTAETMYVVPAEKK